MISPLRFYRMSPRRQDSQDTLFDESANGGDDNDKLDCRLPLFFFFTFRPEAMSHLSTHDSDVHHRSEGMPQDPFLVVQPSLNDSLLVKQGLVDEMTLPPPTHSAHDIQVCGVYRSLPIAMMERAIS
jgi:hypothetical protein